MKKKTMNRRKVLVIGLDGATLDLLNPLVEEGEFPILKKMFENGVVGELRTVFPPVTAAAWASFMTGKNPGKHRIFEFLLRKDGSFDREPVSADTCSGQAIWDLVSNVGKKVGVVNVPVTYPPRQVNGFLISGMLTPPGDERFSFPKTLLPDLERRFGKYRLLHTEVYSPGRVGDVIEELFQVFEYRLKTSRYLLEHHDWDFFMVHFAGIDRLQHELWHIFDPTHPRHDPDEAAKFGSRIMSFFREMDTGLQQLVQSAGEEAVVILMSDHGFGPIHKFVNFNIWLMESGYLKLKEDFVTRVKYALFSKGFTPGLLYKLAMKLGLAKLRLSGGLVQRHKLIRLLKAMFLSMSSVDWSRTRAYSRGNYGQMFINLKGREPQGIVEPGREYEELCDEIIHDLRQLRDPQTGEKIIGEILTKEEFYNGPYVDKAPDISFIARDMRYKPLGILEFASRHLIEDTFGNSGDHRMNGLIALMGEGIRENEIISGAQIIDVAPTILYLLGLPVPVDMDGRVLKEALQEGLLASHPVRYAEAPEGRGGQAGTYSQEESALIEERLKGLGYWG